METIKTFIPSESVVAFEKFAKKTQKNVEGFTYSVGKPYEKLFRHPVINENGIAGYCIKRTEFYALVKGIFKGKVSLDRATKNPKKGIEVVEI